MKQKRQTPKHIIISHVYSSDNKGDAALTSVLISDLKSKFPDAALTILRLEPVKKGSFFEGVPEKPSFMSYALNRYKNPVVKLAYAFYMMCATLVYATILRVTGYHLYLPQHLRAVADLYGQADLIVPVGGGYIRSREGLFNRLNIPLLLHPLLFGYLLGKPAVLYSQSIGPFQNKFEKAMVAFVLKRMTLILLREDTSLALLKSLGLTRNVSRAIDAGFLLRSNGSIDVRSLYHIPADKLLVGVTVRAWLKGDAQKNYEQAVAEALDRLIKMVNAHIIFIPQVTASKGDDDRLVSRRVQALMNNQHAVTCVSDTPDHHRIKALYDSMDALLGTRFHSVIFSLTSYVPVVAIEYEHKTSGIMHDLGLDRWVIKIEDATTEKLSSLIHQLLEQRATYGTYLHIRLPAYVQEARQSIIKLERSFYKANEDSDDNRAF